MVSEAVPQGRFPILVLIDNTEEDYNEESTFLHSGILLYNFGMAYAINDPTRCYSIL